MMRFLLLFIIITPFSIEAQNKMWVTLLESEYNGIKHTFSNKRVFEITQEAGEQHDTIIADTFGDYQFNIYVHQKKFISSEKEFYGYSIECSALGEDGKKREYTGYCHKNETKVSKNMLGNSTSSKPNSFSILVRTQCDTHLTSKNVKIDLSGQQHQLTINNTSFSINKKKGKKTKWPVNIPCITGEWTDMYMVTDDKLGIFGIKYKLNASLAGNNYNYSLDILIFNPTVSYKIPITDFTLSDIHTYNSRTRIKQSKDISDSRVLTVEFSGVILH